MVRNRLPTDPLSVMAARAIRETEVFLADGLLHPERAVRIPVVRVGFGSFAPGLAEEFWCDVLELDGV